MLAPYLIILQCCDFIHISVRYTWFNIVYVMDKSWYHYTMTCLEKLQCDMKFVLKDGL